MVQAATTRECDGCTLCCKVLSIDVLEKPAGTWCANCDIGKGCKIYASRPGNCVAFQCAYLIDPDLDERWKPSTARFVLVSTENSRRIIAHMDPQRPDAWKREPYLSQFKNWARRGAQSNTQIIIMVGRHSWIVFPDREVDLGEVAEDELVVTNVEHTPSGPRQVVHKEPRAAAAAPSPKADQAGP